MAQWIYFKSILAVKLLDIRSVYFLGILNPIDQKRSSFQFATVLIQNFCNQSLKLENLIEAEEKEMSLYSITVLQSKYLH